MHTFIRSQHQRQLSGVTMMVRGMNMPSANVYLHGKPWMAAKALDEKLKEREFRKPSSYLEHIFDCGNCNPRIKEHALCCHHNDFVQLSKKEALRILSETQAATAY